MEDLSLIILSPEETLVDTRTGSVTLPGGLAPFTVLPGHAPIISSLTEGNIAYPSGDGEKKVHISSGFVEVIENKVIVSVEP
ncbi:MAG: hypothetical protein IJM35_04005 [Bacteroidales bacterium]|nr:hypothetical protein [Bacteroidales bacterium]